MKLHHLDLTDDEVILLLRGLALVGVMGRFEQDDDMESSQLWKKITQKTRVVVEGDLREKRKRK